MNFEQDKSIEDIGQKAGFVFAYFMSTAILFFAPIVLFALKITHKIPNNWHYMNIAEIIFAVAILGIVIRWVLK